MDKEELLNKLFNNQRKFTIRFTWVFGFYLLFLICVWYFIGKAIINTYSPSLAGFVWVLFVISYGWSMFLIRKED